MSWLHYRNHKALRKENARPPRCHKKGAPDRQCRLRPYATRRSGQHHTAGAPYFERRFRVLLHCLIESIRVAFVGEQSVHNILAYSRFLAICCHRVSTIASPSLGGQSVGLSDAGEKLLPYIPPESDLRQVIVDQSQYSATRDLPSHDQKTWTILGNRVDDEKTHLVLYSTLRAWYCKGCGGWIKYPHATRRSRPLGGRLLRRCRRLS